MKLETQGDGGVLLMLDSLLGRMEDLTPALQEIGEDQVESTKRRFATATAPDGQPWAPNSQLTLDAYLGLFKNSYKKDGSISKAGEKRSAAKKPGTGETKALQTTINYQLLSATQVAIGSPMIYAGTFQHGAQSGEYGFGFYATRNGSFPIPWGDIPARPFLGFSDADRENILDIVGSYIVGA